MDYELNAGQRRQIIDEVSHPIAEGTTNVVIVDPSIVQLGALNGILHLRGNAEGATDVTITRGAVSSTHSVTVTNPFDWSLGAIV